MSGTVTGFFHAGVTVSDMKRSLRFYRDGLGLAVVSEAITGGDHARRIWGMEVAEVRVVFLGVPGSDARIELFEFRDIERHPASARPCDYGAGHFCLFVEDVDALFERLTAMGYASRGGAVVPIVRGPHAGVRAVYMKDPDGYHVELYQRPPADAPSGAQ
jgi:catechol 2,3-dioxygenase-like lactoylglutathione lyase family enzyme